MLSTRSDVIPHEILAALTMVQHDLRPVGFNEVCAQVERYLGASLDETGTPTRKVDVRACRADDDVAYDVPRRPKEVLDDLRLRRLVIKGPFAKLGPAFDRLGRRLFAGLVVVTLVVSDTTLLAMGRHVQRGFACSLLSYALAGHFVLDVRRGRGRGRLKVLASCSPPRTEA